MAKVFEFPKYEPKPRLRRAPTKVLKFRKKPEFQPVLLPVPFGALGFWLGGLA